MIGEILSHTPAWVFILFVGLLALGLVQTRTRNVGILAAYLLPAGMIALSLAGIHSSFGFLTAPLAAWAFGMAAATALGYTLFRDKRVAYDSGTSNFIVPGSWIPLVVILAIFFAKYVYAVMRAMNLEVINSPLFVAGLSGAYGLLRGYLAARAVNLAMKAREG